MLLTIQNRDEVQKVCVKTGLPYHGSVRKNLNPFTHTLCIIYTLSKFMKCTHILTMHLVDRSTGFESEYKELHGMFCTNIHPEQKA